jgi:hypothetical protein
MPPWCDASDGADRICEIVPAQAVKEIEHYAVTSRINSALAERAGLIKPEKGNDSYRIRSRRILGETRL